MASTYSTSLQLQLISNGEQSGVWGTTTNTNWNLIEQAVAGVQAITMSNANYTLSVLNGVSDESRNMVLVVGGSNSAIRQIIAPLVPKVYMVNNNTSGGYAITVGGATGTLVTVPNGASVLVYCDGTNFYSGVSGVAGNFNIPGNNTVAGNETIGGTLSVTGNATFSGTIAGTLASTVTGTTQSSSDNSTKIATTAYVTTAVTNATGSLGTMSTQNANNVNITGGSISGLGTALPVASGGTGVTTSTGSGNAVLSNSPALTTPDLGTPSNLVATNASGTANNLNAGIGVNQTWTVFNSTTRAFNTTYTNSTGKPIYVLVSSSNGYSLTAYVNGVALGSTSSGNSAVALGMSWIVPNGSTYSLSSSATWQGWSELR